MPAVGDRFAGLEVEHAVLAILVIGMPGTKDGVLGKSTQCQAQVRIDFGGLGERIIENLDVRGVWIRHHGVRGICGEASYIRRSRILATNA